jgi:hypothetical protein
MPSSITPMYTVLELVEPAAQAAAALEPNALAQGEVEGPYMPQSWQLGLLAKYGSVATCTREQGDRRPASCAILVMKQQQ